MSQFYWLYFFIVFWPFCLIRQWIVKKKKIGRTWEKGKIQNKKSTAELKLQRCNRGKRYGKTENMWQRVEVLEKLLYRAHQHPSCHSFQSKSRKLRFVIKITKNRLVLCETSPWTTSLTPLRTSPTPTWHDNTVQVLLPLPCLGCVGTKSRPQNKHES